MAWRLLMAEVGVDWMATGLSVGVDGKNSSLGEGAPTRLIRMLLGGLMMEVSARTTRTGPRRSRFIEDL